MKTGRNDPCPCGSGKKYKKCCLYKAAAPVHELVYRRLSEARDRLVDRLMRHARRIFGPDVVRVAMHEFLLWPDEQDEIGEDMLDRIGPLFWPWFVFNWEYDAIDAGGALRGPEGRTVAELYAETQGGRLDTLDRHLIGGVNRKPYSFLEVVSVDQGKGMALADILKGERITVQERTGSQYVTPGDVVFGRAVMVDGVGMLIGLGTTLIPPGAKTQIIGLRKRLRRGGAAVTDDTLYDWDTEIRELYFGIDASLHSAPDIHNTDGDRLEFHRLVYDITDAQQAFERLCDLCTTMTPEALADDARRDSAGRIVGGEIPWDRQGHKKMAGMPNTILGRVVIDNRRLTAEVNSAERAAELRRRIDARLGGVGMFRVDEIRGLDAAMTDGNDPSAERIGDREHEMLMQDPQVQAQLAEMFANHWESWVDQEIPALGGKTPRQAVKTADGREAVEALLTDVERGRGQDGFTQEINRDGARRARQILGLNGS